MHVLALGGADSNNKIPQYEGTLMSAGGAVSGFVRKITETSWSCTLRALSTGLLGSGKAYPLLAAALSQAVLLDGTALMDAESGVERKLIEMVREDLHLAQDVDDTEIVSTFWKAVEQGEMQLNVGEIWALVKKLGFVANLCHGAIQDGKIEIDLAGTLSRHLTRFRTVSLCGSCTGKALM